MILTTRDTLTVPEPLGPPHGGESPGFLLADVERAHIVRVLDECGGRIKGPHNAAERLGLKPSTLRDRMRKLGVATPSRSGPHASR